MTHTLFYISENANTWNKSKSNEEEEAELDKESSAPASKVGKSGKAVS